jgi:hypothetical protein
VKNNRFFFTFSPQPLHAMFAIAMQQLLIVAKEVSFLTNSDTKELNTYLPMAFLLKQPLCKSRASQTMFPCTEFVFTLTRDHSTSSLASRLLLGSGSNLNLSTTGLALARLPAITRLSVLVPISNF